MIGKWSKNSFGFFFRKYFFENPLGRLFYDFYKAGFQCCTNVALHVTAFDDDRVFRWLVICLSGLLGY